MLSLEEHTLVASPKNKSGNSTILFACSLKLRISHVLTSSLDIFVDLDSIDNDIVLNIDHQLDRVQEGLAHGGQLGDVVI